MVYFETDKSAIKPISMPILDAVAATLKGNPDVLLVEVQGHTDEREETSLSFARAAAVTTYLRERGVDASRLVQRGHGTTRSRCKAHNEGCWSKNRRVEFVILRRAEDPPRP